MWTGVAVDHPFSFPCDTLIWTEVDVDHPDPQCEYSLVNYVDVDNPYP